ncbi:MAG: HDIG domain-containing protein [Candidatus Omnitrophica bacterium]|nr:HDIG domain-containing protein [Candidatus Omnitrophota bacterium]
MTAMFHKNQQVTWADRLLRGLIYTGSFGLVLFLLVYDRSSDSWDYNFKEGEPSPRTVYAPFDFSYVNQKATEEARQRVSLQSLPVYRTDLNIEKDAVGKIKALFEELQGNRKSRKKDKVVPSSLFYESLAFSEDEIKMLRDEKEVPGWQTALEAILSEVFHTGITQPQDKLTLMAQGRNKILLAEDKQEFEIDTAKLITLDDARNRVQEKLQEKFGRNRRLKDAFARILNSVIIANLILDEKASAKHREAAVKGTAEIKVDIKRGELVVQRGRRIGGETVQILSVIQKRTQSREILQKIFSQALIVFLLYLLLGSYFKFFEPKLGFSVKHLLLIHSLLVLNLLISKVILYFHWGYYLIPISLASLLLVPLVKPRIGFSVGFISAALSSLLCGWSLEVFLFGLFGSLMGVFSANGLRKRIQFVTVGLTVGAAQGITIFAAQLFQGIPVLDAAKMSALGLANGLLITMPLFSLLLPVFEHLFNLTTDITLLELSDLNHPLLKKMVIEAPGTYHHSLIVSHLSEEAAKAIGANALLARVGSYFHDIGKMVKSEYFVENQPSREETKHTDLTPQMSYMIILSHVKKGIELARKNKLKDVIINFIPEHQGTGVIYYFYRKALDQKKDGEVINSDDFRYPGPKPQSKETAIVMLADSSEAASRSLEAYTPEVIRELVTRIILDKLKDGQLDECDLTVKDLDDVKESFIRSLMAVYHSRIPYPKQDEEKSLKSNKLNHGRDQRAKVSTQ